jgi:hypothetical protein
MDQKKVYERPTLVTRETLSDVTAATVISGPTVT